MIHPNVLFNFQCKNTNNIYNDKALLQISGRVGRVIKATSGDVYYVCKKKTEYMEKAIKFTILANSKL